MDSNETKCPNAALINREWFEAAQNVLPEEQLGRVLLNACCYVFGKTQYMMPEATSRAVFAMIKPALDSDIAKYLERCARNAANARKGVERVAASGSEWQRVVANTTTTTTTTPTPTTTLSREEEQVEIERQKFLIAGYFFSKGSESPVEEMSAFWNYYESLGWKNNKGAAIVRKQAAAAMWHCQFALGRELEGAGIWFECWSRAQVYDLRVWSCFRSIVRVDDATAHLRCSCKPDFFEWLKGQAMPVLGGIAQRLKVQNITFGD